MTVQESTDSQPANNQPTRRVPLDMLGVCLVALGSVLVYYTVSLSAVRFLAAVPLLFFLPGYVFVSILFPRTGRPPKEATTDHTQPLSTARNLDRVTVPERLALSFGLSIAFVPLFGLLLEVLPVDAFDNVIAPALVGSILVGTAIGTVRRLQLPPGDQFQVPTAAITTSLLAPVSGSMPRTERVVTLALAVAIVVAIISVGYVFAAPQDGEQYTDLRILTESTDGELTFGDYPDEVSTDEETDLVVGIDNHEQSAQTYTVVVTAEQLLEDDEGVTPIESTELDRFTITLNDSERLEQPQTVVLGTTGEYRLNYYLYTDEPPETVDSETAYRHTHFTVSVVDGDEPDDGATFDSSIDTDDATIEPITAQPPALTDEES